MDIIWQLSAILTKCAMMVLLLRFGFQIVQSSTLHPFVSSTYRATAITDTMSHGLPRLAGGRFNLAVVILLFVLQVISTTIGSMAQGSFNHSPLEMFMLSTVEVADWFLAFYYWVLIIVFILSWAQMVSPQAAYYHELFRDIATPILEPLERFIPPLGPFSIAFIIALLGIGVVRRILAYSAEMWRLA